MHTSLAVGGGLGWSSATAMDDAARRITLLTTAVDRLMLHPHWLHDRIICNLYVLGKWAFQRSGRCGLQPRYGYLIFAWPLEISIRSEPVSASRSPLGSVTKQPFGQNS